MNCAEVRSKLSAYHDGELDAGLHERVAAHLAACGSCRAQLGGLTRLSELFQIGGQCDLPDEIWGRIAAAAQPRARRTWRRWVVRVGAVAAGFAVYIIGHEALVASVGGRGAVSPTAMQVETALHETAFLLTGQGLVDDELAALSRRPEVLLVQQVAGEVVP